MFQKTNEERKNQNRDKDKAYISRDESERNLNCDNSFARFNFKKHDDLNEEEHETKSEQIIKRTLFQRIRSALSKTKKQYELIREKKAL